MNVRSIYLHVPFCRRKCGYCNFTLIAGRDDLIGEFLSALESEIQTSCATFPHEIDTLYLGGGTPSHLSTSALDHLFTILRTNFVWSKQAEITCEVNPLDCTPAKLDLLSRHGVNRLSLGGQSFSDRKLKVLERDHTGENLSTAIEAAKLQFANISLDLIFAAPDESLAEWSADLDQACSFDLQHFSTYGLTVERGSAFYGRAERGDLTEVREDEQLEMYQLAISKLVDWGCEHYEISSFAKPGRRSRHNQAYWRGQSWLGFGPGAASFVDQVRWVNHRSTTSYIKRLKAGQPAIAERDELSLEQLVRERFVFGLRQLQGVNLDELDQLWQTSSPSKTIETLFQPHLSEYIERGWLAREQNQIRLTPTGLVISDSLWPNFLQQS